MALNYDVDTLIAQVRVAENIPDGAQPDSDLLQFLNEELLGSIYPTILKCREDFFTVTQDFVFPNDNTIQNRISIPPAAIGYKLREVFMLDQNGNFFDVPRLTPSEAATFSGGWNATTSASFGGYMGFYVQGNTIMIYPYTAAKGNTFRLLFHARPAELVQTSACGQITTINVINGLLALSNIPTDWTANTKVDILQPTPPFDYVQNMFVSNTVYTTPQTLTNQSFQSAPSGNLVFVDPLLADQLAQGQWVCATGTAPFVQFMPPDVYPLLKQATAIRCLRALNDTEAEQMAIQKFKMLQDNVVNNLLTPRVEAEAKKIHGSNTIGKYTRNRGRC